MIPYPMFQQPAYQQPVQQPAFQPTPAYAMPGFPQSAPQQQQQPYMPPPPSWQPAAQTPVLAAQALETNQPRARGYAPETPPTPPVQAPQAPRTIKLPSPEDLGVASRPFAGMTLPAASETIDWNQAHERLRNLGVTGFHLDRLAGGVTRVVLVIPSAQPGQNRQVEALGAGDAAALATAMERIGEPR